ncbi:TetR/AcrR family transcriptional regulator [Kiloniella laminariae]|uniref:TetR/AcrR family transcriptional regulator n=1 Tax=Kiloniella laminariae TaxID=454162 RepID=UPI00035F065C|nr:TetR/AcrR family transcriptional regulator [Kiloniella laminariae]
MKKTGSAGRPFKNMENLSKDLILRHALCLIDEGGADAASFRVLAKALNVTPMAVSHHVGNRKKMLSSLVKMVFDGVGEKPEGKTPQARLRMLLSRYCEQVLLHPNLIQCVLADLSLMDEQLLSLTELIRLNLKEANQSNDDILLNLLIDYTHGFAVAAAAAPKESVLSLQDYLKSLDWILDRLEG